MTLVKVIDATTFAALPEIDILAGDNLQPLLGADTYRLIRSDETSVSVAALVAGTIDQAGPEIGDTLTVSGSNESTDPSYQWQKSADGSTGITDLSGEIAADYDTTAFTATEYVRRGVSDGVQGPVYTPFVQVSAVASYTEQGVVFSGSQYLDSANAISANSPTMLLFASFNLDATSRDAIFQANGGGDFYADYVGAGSPRYSFDTDTNAAVSAGTVGAAGVREHVLLSAEPSTGSPGDIEYTCYLWDSTSASWSLHSSFLIAGTTIVHGGVTDGYRIGDRLTGGHQFIGTLYRFTIWTGLTIPDISSSLVQANFASGGSLVDPATSQAAYGNPKLDAYGNAATWNAGTFTFGGAHTVTGTLTDEV